ncbi:MAG: DEAD/DEAH box helicase [Hydrogenophilus sp.]|nr:DEAD/DEAH box helicase [Hydrogenophilus sp.]
MVPWPGRETEGCAVVTLRPLEPVLRLACELLQREPKRRGTLRVSRYEVGVVAAAAAWVQFEEGSRLASALAELRRGGPPRVPPPRGLQAVLRPYQEEGLAWLQFWRRYRWHGVLADDMGLGKTLQTIAHLLCEQEQGRLQQPALVVAPTSVVGGWVRALAQFAPSLRVIAWQGTERKGEQERLKKTDVVVTSYPLVWRDAPLLTAEEWSVVVLDEAQMVKNPRARAAIAVRRLHAEQRLCLTGTPMENHLGELWAIFDWLLPGFLGSEGFFQREYRIPIEREGDEARLEFLRRRVRPFLVRRSKGEVAEDLPPKSEIVEVLTLGERQAAVYEAIRVSMQERVRQAWAERGLAKSQWTVLDALLKLRQCCCDPSLVDVPQAKRVRESVKLEWLRSRLPELVAEGRRVLLFSQFVTFLRRVEELLREQGIAYEVLTGETRDRQGVVERFERGESPVFLLSLRAGGTGLNLTAADTVVVLDPWWNPAVEEQAIDRVHRIGQERPVFVYKLICAQTVEEQVVALQRQKRALFDGALAGGEASGEKGLREEEIEALLAVTPVQRRERSAPA